MLIDHHPVFSTTDVCCKLEKPQNEGVHKEIKVTIAPEQKLSLQDMQGAANNCGPFAPTTKWDDTAAITEDAEDPPFMD